MAKRNKNAKNQEGAGPFAEVPQYGNNQMDQMSRMSQLFEGDNSAFFPDDPTIVLPENQDEMDTIMKEKFLTTFEQIRIEFKKVFVDMLIKLLSKEVNSLLIYILLI